MMTVDQAIKSMKQAMDTSPRNAYVAELHLQAVKYADVLEGLSGRELTEALGIPASFGTEILKMRKIAPRLLAAGMDPSRL